MASIPKQLQNKEFRFVLLGKWNKWKNPKTKEVTEFAPDFYKKLMEEKDWKPLGKAPFETKWQDKGYNFNDPKLIQHIKNGGNYGVIGGYGNLIILDKDDDKLDIDLDTFTIETGSGGKHYYLISPYKNNHVFVNEYGELRANNYQVVGANCTHPCGEKYKVIKDIPIKHISKQDLIEIIKPYVRLKDGDKPFDETLLEATERVNKKGKDTSRSGLEYRRAIAEFRKGMSREEVRKRLMAYKKFADAVEQYQETTLDNAESFVLQEQDKEKEKEIERTIELSPEKKEELKLILGETFDKIKEILEKYVKLKKEYYDLIAVWIIGTYFMPLFNTYPYLFVNAQKGSGKTRLLKLIEVLVKDGELLASMREAVLFRMASMGKTLLIDELEGLERKENAPLKELLNACYKRGTKVYRMKKKGEDYVLDPFTPFTPIAIANISGTDDVLGDRCVPIHLDKSKESVISLIQEDFNSSPVVQQIKGNFEIIMESGVGVCTSEYTIKSWNEYINLRYTNTTLHTQHTQHTHNTRDTSKSLSEGSVYDFERVSVYNRIVESGLNGRQLELIFPLLMVSLMINEEVFVNVLSFSKELMEKKREDDITESNDVSLIDFISKMSSQMDYDRYRFVYKITEEFRFFMGIRDKFEQQDINPTWVGRALKRMGLVIERRRLSSGVEVRLNVAKATNLLKNAR